MVRECDVVPDKTVIIRVRDGEDSLQLEFDVWYLALLKPKWQWQEIESMYKVLEQILEERHGT